MKSILFLFIVLSLSISWNAFGDVTMKAFRGPILHFYDGVEASPTGWKPEFFEDGLLVIREGHVHAVGGYSKIVGELPPSVTIEVFDDKLIVPGFIDTHVHYPQTEMIAAYGEQLLEWLDKYTFPTELKYKDFDYARSQAAFFIHQMLKNGTTSALVFATVYPESVDAIFEEAMKVNMRMISGKVMMDRHAPEGLLDHTKASYEDSKRLLEKWHGKGRLSYAVTPRFAPTSSRKQLELAGRLKAEYPSVYLHTHLSENKSEIEWVSSLFPERSGYLDVYDFYGLTGERSIFAHGIHLTDIELDKMRTTNSVLSFCPSSHLFLGSGLFPLAKVEKLGIRVGIGTDVGAGTSFSLLKTLGYAYMVNQLQGHKFSAFQGFYLATLGGAKALSIDDKVGNFERGKEADFVVLDLKATQLQELRYALSEDLEQRLFYSMILGDDRNIAATYILGKPVYQR